MSDKDFLVQAMENLPDGVGLFAGTAIPSPDSISCPTTVDEAIIAQGVLAYNINKILAAFGGLTPVELVLRIGQMNPVIQGLLLAALSAFAETEGNFEIVAPIPTVYPTFEDFQVEESGDKTISEAVGTLENAGLSFQFADQGGGVWTATQAVDPGYEVLTVTVTFEDEMSEVQEVSFTVGWQFDVYPDDGDSPYTGTITFEIADPDGVIDTASVSYENDDSTVSGGGGMSGGGGASGTWTLDAEITTPDSYTATFEAVDAEGNTVTKTVSFAVQGME